MAKHIQPNFLRDVNNLLTDLELPWDCSSSEEPDGNSFFNGVFSQLQNRDIKARSHFRAKYLKSGQDLRESVTHWAKKKPDLMLDVLQMEDIKPMENLDSYLNHMKKNGVGADRFIICMTAMFLGKNIFLTSESCTKEHPWNPIILDKEECVLDPPITLACLNQRKFQSLLRKPRENDECMGCGWRGMSVGDHFLESTKYCAFFQDTKTLSLHLNHPKSIQGKYPCATVRLRYDDFEDEDCVPCFHPYHHSGIYKMVKISPDDQEQDIMHEASSSLDEQQRFVLDCLVKFAKQRCASSDGTKPIAPLLAVDGGWRPDRTHLIKTLATVCEFFFQKEIDMPDKYFPAVLKLAPTVMGAREIDGMTMHYAFKLNFDNEYTPLCMHDLQTMRRALRHLAIIILDQMTLVSADKLYQLHHRLQEIMQIKEPFGGVSIILCGNLLNQPPKMSRFSPISEDPQDEKYRLFKEIWPLWEMFDSIHLTHNYTEYYNKQEIACDNLNKALLSRDTRLVRPAWKPRWSDQPTGRPYATKFGGSQPYQRPGFKWPTCSKNKHKMDFRPIINQL